MSPVSTTVHVTRPWDFAAAAGYVNVWLDSRATAFQIAKTSTNATQTTPDVTETLAVLTPWAPMIVYAKPASKETDSFAIVPALMTATVKRTQFATCNHNNVSAKKDMKDPLIIAQTSTNVKSRAIVTITPSVPIYPDLITAHANPVFMVMVTFVLELQKRVRLSLTRIRELSQVLMKLIQMEPDL